MADSEKDGGKSLDDNSVDCEDQNSVISHEIINIETLEAKIQLVINLDDNYASGDRQVVGTAVRVVAIEVPEGKTQPVKKAGGLIDKRE